MYKVMYDDVTGEYETQAFPTFKEAMKWGRQHAIETANYITAHAIRKDGSYPDSYWLIDPWGKIEYRDN